VHQLISLYKTSRKCRGGQPSELLVPFATSPTYGIEAIAGLMPIPLHLKKLLR